MFQFHQANSVSEHFPLGSYRQKVDKYTVEYIKACYKPTFLSIERLLVDTSHNVSNPNMTNVRIPQSSHVSTSVFTVDHSSEAVNSASYVPRMKDASAIMRVADEQDDSITMLKLLLFPGNQKANDIGTMVVPEDIFLYEWSVRKDHGAGFFPDRWSRAKWASDEAFRQNPNLACCSGPIR